MEIIIESKNEVSFAKCSAILTPTNKIESSYNYLIVQGKTDKYLPKGKLSFWSDLNVDTHIGSKEFNENLIIVNINIYSDEKIENNDWCINEKVNKTCIITHSEYTNWYDLGWRKIISSTDISLHTPIEPKPGEEDLEIYLYYILPQPEISFIEKYIKEYNSNNVITEVWCEYTDMDVDQWFDELDDKLYVQYQKEMNIYDHELGPPDENDIKEMYKNNYQKGFVIDETSNKVNIRLKNEIEYGNSIFKRNEVKYSENDIEKYVRLAMQEKGFTPEYEVKEFMIKNFNWRYE